MNNFNRWLLAATTPFFCTSLLSVAIAANEKPVAPVENDSFRESVTFITLRNKTGSEEISDYFGGERDILRAGFCDISSMQLPALKSIAESVPFYVPEDILQLEKVQEYPVAEFWKNLKKTSGQSLPLLYTHGFNISFERGCKRAAEFQRSLNPAGKFVLFSWPSDGVIINYAPDEADVYWSVDPLQKVLHRMVQTSGAGRINVVAHSLGTRATYLALVRLAAATKRKATDGPLINQLVLLAADVDAGIFKQYLPLIKPLVKNITIYVSENDGPLQFSSQLHGYPRLGESGHHLDGLQGAEIIDVSDVPVHHPSGHLYHLYNERVISDLDQLLNKNKTAASRKSLKQSGSNYWRLQPSSGTAATKIE